MQPKPKVKETEKECPSCGSKKHQEIIKIKTEEGGEAEHFHCKACDHKEFMFNDLDEKREKESIERMGDAFRDFLKSRKKK